MSKFKLFSSGRVTLEGSFSPSYLVISSPSTSEIEFVILKKSGKRMIGIIPLYNIHLQNSLRVPRGNVEILIENQGYDENLNKKVIKVVAR